MSSLNGGFNRCLYTEYEDGLNDALDPNNYPAIGVIQSVDSFTGLVSGVLVDMRRPFTSAICVSIGGNEWGVTYAPRVGDGGLVLFNIASKALFIPFSGYGVTDATDPKKLRLLTVEEAADRGLKRSEALPGPLDPGEVHAHSYGHAETLMDNMGNWFAADGVGDYMYMDTNTASIRMRAWYQTVQQFGITAEGEPAVTIVAGNMDDDGKGVIWKDENDVVTPKPGVYHLKVKGDIVLEAENGAIVRVNSDGSIQIEAGTDPDTGEPAVVSVGGGYPVLYSKLPDATLPISQFGDIGVSNTVTVGGLFTDITDDPKDP